MNDLDVRDRDDVIDRDRQGNPAVDREIKSPAKHRPPVRRRWGKVLLRSLDDAGFTTKVALTLKPPAKTPKPVAPRDG